jgi:hypothetical protein
MKRCPRPRRRLRHGLQDDLFCRHQATTVRKVVRLIVGPKIRLIRVAEDGSCCDGHIAELRLAFVQAEVKASVALFRG